MASKLVLISVFILDIIAFGLAIGAEQRRSTVSITIFFFSFISLSLSVLTQLLFWLLFLLSHCSLFFGAKLGCGCFIGFWVCWILVIFFMVSVWLLRKLLDNKVLSLYPKEKEKMALQSFLVPNWVNASLVSGFVEFM